MKTVILQITAAAFALSAFGAEPSVKVTFVRFGSYLGPGQTAVINLTNVSDKTFEYFTDGCTIKDVGVPGAYMERGCFVSQSPTGQVVWIQPGVGPGPVRELLPGKATNIAVLLPQDGRTGRVGVLQTVSPRPRDFNWPRVECDQEIQCAHDGMPPRILPATETKR